MISKRVDGLSRRISLERASLTRPVISQLPTSTGIETLAETMVLSKGVRFDNDNKLYNWFPLFCGHRKADERMSVERAECTLIKDTCFSTPQFSSRHNTTPSLRRVIQRGSVIKPLIPLKFKALPKLNFGFETI